MIIPDLHPKLFKKVLNLIGRLRIRDDENSA